VKDLQLATEPERCV